jgi:hypothetical protein
MDSTGTRSYFTTGEDGRYQLATKESYDASVAKKRGSMHPDDNKIAFNDVVDVDGETMTMPIVPPPPYKRSRPTESHAMRHAQKLHEEELANSWFTAAQEDVDDVMKELGATRENDIVSKEQDSLCRMRDAGIISNEQYETMMDKLILHVKRMPRLPVQAAPADPLAIAMAVAGIDKVERKTALLPQPTQKEPVEVVAFTAAPETKKAKVAVRINKTWSILTQTITYHRTSPNTPKGLGIKGAFEALTIARVPKDPQGKVFSFNIPIRNVANILRAVTVLDDHCPDGTLVRPTFEEYKALPVNPDGLQDLEAMKHATYPNTMYTVDGTYTVQVRDEVYRTSTGTGSYEALVITKLGVAAVKPTLEDKEKKEEKPFSISMPSRMIPTLRSAIEYVMTSRKLEKSDD